MKSLREIQDILQTQKSRLENEFGVYPIGVFGSYVRGEQTQQSDVDVLIELSDPVRIDLIRLIQLEQELSDLIGVHVDLVIKEDLKPGIGRRVMDEVIPL